MKKQAVLCPGPEHRDHKKTLLFMSGDKIYVNCKTHGWINVQFIKAGKPVSFAGCGVKIEKAKWEFIDSVPVPTVSVGGFNKKSRDK